MFAYDDGGTAMVGVISLVQLIPAAVIAPLGSTLGDRFRRERIFLLAEISMSFACALAAAAALLGAPAVLVYAAACSVGWILTLVRPAHGALLPWIVRDPAELTTAYTAAGLIESVCVLLGPLLATMMFALAAASGTAGPGLVYAALALMLAVGSLLVAGIHPVGRPPKPDRDEPVLREMTAGFRYVWSDPRPRVLVGLLGLAALTLGFVDTVIVVLAFAVLGTGQTGVGVLNTVLGVGGVIGAATAVVAGHRERLFPAFRTGAVLYGVPLTAIGALPPLSPLLLGLTGMGGVLLDVSGRTMLQRLIPDHKLTRSLGVLETAYMAAEGLGAFFGALLTTAIGPEWTIVLGGALVPLAGFAFRRRLRSVDVGARVPADDLDLLRRTSLFGPLPPPALERLARNCVPLLVKEGTVVIREGDEGDRVYVIAEGRAEVSQAGRWVATLTAGGYVGEIALLRDVARTATVIASADTRLLCLERDVFLRTMSGHESAHTAARLAAEDRLRELSDHDPPEGSGGPPEGPGRPT